MPGIGYPPLLVTLARSGDRVLMGTNAIFPERFFQEHYEGALVASGRMHARPYFEKSSTPRYRIVMAGASTVQGYPHPHRLAAPAFLEAMLADALPEHQVEVFNLGITSIASFAVARTVEQALALKPDAVVIYTGHNEFYGLYGAGSSALSNRVRYDLLSWRLPSAIRSIIDWAGGRAVSSEQLLETMANRGAVAWQDDRRRAALQALKQNLRFAVNACRAAGVRPVLCTLAANEEGFAPALSASPDSQSVEGRRWWTHVNSAVATMLRETQGAASVALAHLDSARDLSDDSAWLAFLRGRALRRLQRHRQANLDFIRARDLDTMPWRAPASHGAAIRQVAQDLDVGLADVEAAFVAAAEPIRPGWTLFSDHVHPTVAGQVLLARVVAQRLLEKATDRLRSDADYLRQQGYVAAEAVRVDQAMAELLGSPPMDRYNRDAAQRFGQRAADGWRKLSDAEQQGAQRWMSNRQETPLALELADQLYADGRFAAALRHYRAARLESPFTPRADLWSAVQLGWCARLTGNTGAEVREELSEALDRANFVAQAPGVDQAFMAFVSGSLHHFLGHTEAALAGLEEAFQTQAFRQSFVYSLFPPLAEALVAVGRTQDALHYATVAAADAGNSAYFKGLVESFVESGG